MPLTAASLGRKLPGFRRGNGGYGGGQWKRWGCSMEKMGMLNGKAPSCLRCREIEATIRQREKMLQMAMFFRTPVGPSLLRADEGGQWRRWGCSMEKMGMLSGKDGDVQWNLMGMFNGKCTRISPANRALFCGSGTLAYVVYVLLNAFVCTTGRPNHGEVSRGGCANAVRAG
jgi:hypothetical protein